MKKNKINYNLIVSIVVLVIVLGLSIYFFINRSSLNNLKLIALFLGLLITVSILSIIGELTKNKKLAFITPLVIIIFAVASFFIIKKTDTGSTGDSEKVPNFVGKNVSEAITWGANKNVEITQNYEYSDTVLENVIFAQDILANSMLDGVDKIIITISGGINYDKKVVLPSYVGQDIESFIAEKEALYLNNVIIKYEVNDYNMRNTIISQSKTGEIRRSDEVKVVVSLGKKSELTAVNMPDLVGKELFDASLLLEQNAISYEIKYSFSDQAKDTVVSQSVEAGEVVKPFSTKVTITVSKGSKIIVPNLLTMSVSEIVKWVTDNNLKISLSDTYDSKTPVGDVVSANYKENDEVSEGTTIKVVTSKGPLKMPSFKSLNEFRQWANTYDVKYDEEYVFSNTVPKGNIIKFSLSTNDLIIDGTPIVVTISSGKSLTIPNFVGKTKSEITTSCNNLGLNCSFTYGAYSTTPKDVATAQNKKAGSTVVSGTSVLITLSKGSAKTYTVDIYESQLTFGNADATINTLKTYFASNYPGVTFKFVKKKTNQYPNSGYIHESSPIKDGSKVTQGTTYEVWITIK